MTLFDAGQSEGTLLEEAGRARALLEEAGRARMEQARRSAVEEANRRDAIQEGHAAAKRAEAATSDAWNTQADAAIRTIARAFQRFTTDDVWEHGQLPDAPNNRALGQRMLAAKGRGDIHSTLDYMPTRRKVAHGRPVRYWESSLFDPVFSAEFLATLPAGDPA